jgi:hypothetical protein
MNWFEQIFHFTPQSLREGRLTFVGPLSPQVLVLVVAVAVLGVWLAYRMVAQRTSVRAWRTVLALRIALVLVLLFLLADPALRWMHGRSEVFTAVLVDTSRSMAHRRGEAGPARRSFRPRPDQGARQGREGAGLRLRRK